jgi:thioredoxin 1
VLKSFGNKEQNMAELTLTDANFDEEVIKSDLPILVDFWAVWCGPCKMQNPILEEVEKEMEGKAKVGKLNVDDNPESASKYGVMSIPTLMLFKSGQVVKQFIGVQSKETLLSEFKKVIQ